MALALALEAPKTVAGLVLLSGYYYAVPHVNARSPSRSPIMDEFLIHAVMPFVGHAMALSALRAIFAPCIVPEKFKSHYSVRLALRPSQMKAVAEEAEMLSDSAEALSRHYKELDVPVHLIAGSDDRIVATDKHSARLHRELGTSTFCNVPGKGHMVHHAAPHEVITAIAGVGRQRRIERASRPATRGNWQRDWLHVSDSDQGREHGTNCGPALGANFYLQPGPHSRRHTFARAFN